MSRFLHTINILLKINARKPAKAVCFDTPDHLAKA